MTVFWNELLLKRRSLLVWTLSVGLMLVICVLLFPEMSGQMNEVNDMFANMGSFTAMFGMDRVSFGDMIGFYAIECGNVLGIGGGLFAAFVGISALSHEERERTAEFLLTHPVSRASVVAQKLLAVLTEVTVFNAAILLMGIGSIAAIGEWGNAKAFFLLHLAYFLLQVQLVCICFGLSAFFRRDGIGLGLGLATTLYFLNLIANLSDKAEFLKFITPYGYAEACDIVADLRIAPDYLAVGLLLTAAGVAAAFWKYTRKDIAS